MPTAFLEIVELPDGRIVSADAREFLQGQHVEVAKAMLSAGLQMAGRLVEGELPESDGPRVLH